MFHYHCLWSSSSLALSDPSPASMFICLIVKRLAGDFSLALAVLRAGNVYTVLQHAPLHTICGATAALPIKVCLRSNWSCSQSPEHYAAAGWHQLGAVSSMTGASYGRGRRKHERDSLSHSSSVCRRVGGSFLPSPWAEHVSCQVVRALDWEPGISISSADLIIFFSEGVVNHIAICKRMETDTLAALSRA